MLVVISLSPLTTSLLLALQRLSTSQPVTVILPAENDTLSCNLPRHVTLELCTSPISVWDKLASVPPTGFVALFRDSLLLVPEALGLACAVAQEQAGKYVTFVDTTGKSDSRGVIFSVQRHWSVGAGLSSSFVTTVRTLLDDADVWREMWSATPKLQWSAVELLQNRKVLSPLPSLAAPLPLSDATNPPGVQWSTLQEFTNKSG
jgi:hypothetical protein